MKEIRLTFYKSNRKNAKSKLKTYSIYCNTKNVKSEYKKTMDFYDAVDRITSQEFKYVSIAATNYSVYFFNDYSLFEHNTLDIPESKRYFLDRKKDVIEIVKMIYHYMILFGADFDISYNPFNDPNVIYHIGKM